MKKTYCFVLFVALWAQIDAPKTITLDDCFTLYKFLPQGGGGFRYLADGMHYGELDEAGLHIRDIRDAKQDSLLPLDLPEDLKGFDDYVFSGDESKIMLRTGTEPVYRHSVLANYVVKDLKTGEIAAVWEGGKQQFAALSPLGDKVLFVADNNLFFKDLQTKKVVQITSDGQKNEIINGVPDWVYEEEFSPVTGDGMVAVRWSPDGTKIAFLRFDERKVPEFPLEWYEGGVYPRRTKFKYPKVGEPNSVVTAHWYDLATETTTLLDVNTSPDDYLVRINWMPKGELVITRLNRQQNRLDLVYQNPKQDKVLPLGLRTVPVLLTDRDDAYVDVHDNLHFLSDGKRYLWTSEESGFNHLYIKSTDGTVDKALTSGNFDLINFYGLDEKNGKFYYQTATPTPMDRQIWEGDLSGRAPKLLTEGSGTFDAEFSPTFDFYTLTWSDANTPAIISVRNRAGKVLHTLTDNAPVKELRALYGFAEKEFWSFALSDGTLLNGWMIKPKNMVAGKKYPVLFDNYGGPGSQTVQNQYDGYMGSWHQMLVQKGVIIVSLDNRGTGARGRAFKKCTHLQLGKLETEDQIAAARYLGTLPFVDKNRIGIWGWSFGGYLSTSCILKGNDVFRMAMAVAPVTNWKWYDSAYTERYMHTGVDNGRGYEENSPVNFAERLRGGNYLVCHGIADDNVHFQQTAEIINALIRANKQFDTYYYPNRNHGIYGDNATRHLFTKLTDFVIEKL